MCHVIAADVSDEEECRLLYSAVRGDDLEIVINNAGFGLFVEFLDTDLDEELRMIDTNIRAVHILTKLAVQDFAKRGHGYILNVASSAGFLPGPLMATYYATKNYVLRLTQALREELRHRNSAAGRHRVQQGRRREVRAERSGREACGKGSGRRDVRRENGHRSGPCHEGDDGCAAFRAGQPARAHHLPFSA